MNKTPVGIIGATGYAGLELLRLLLSHPQAEVAAISSVSFEGKEISEVYPSLRNVCDKTLGGEDEVVAESKVVFAALPAGLSEDIAGKCTAQGKFFLDLGADFRLDDEAVYTKWYKQPYRRPDLHAVSAYGLPELFREQIKGCKIVGVPGCYPTSAALGLAPALRLGLVRTQGIVIDSKSGVTGAGRGLTQTSHFPDCNEAFSPYKIAAHRHTPEIEQTLSKLAGGEVRVTFVPHLLPVNRGIVSTIYADLSAPRTAEEIHAAYADFYKNEPFVRVRPLGETANLRNVRLSNFCDISVHVDEHTQKLILVSTIDNMVKGSAGEAVQNMNILLGFPETTGLELIPTAF